MIRGGVGETEEEKFWEDNGVFGIRDRIPGFVFVWLKHSYNTLISSSLHFTSADTIEASDEEIAADDELLYSVLLFPFCFC